MVVLVIEIGNVKGGVDGVGVGITSLIWDCWVCSVLWYLSSDISGELEIWICCSGDRFWVKDLDLGVI